jgi:hypothetical protein
VQHVSHWEGYPLTMGAKVLVCETSGHHDECLPPFVSTLLSLDIEHDTIVNAGSLALKGNIFSCFAETSGILAEGINPSSANFQILEERIQREAYSFVYVNTMSSGMVKFWLRQQVPLLAVCHNIDRFGEDNIQPLLSANPRSRIVVLSPHVKDYLLTTFPDLPADKIVVHYSTATLAPRFFGSVRNGITITVPGTISFHNRAYMALAKALDGFTPPREVRICFPGGIGEGERDRFAKLFQSRGLVTIEAPALQYQGLERRHELFSATHEEYYSIVGASDILLPLIKQKNNRYTTKSITSTMPMSVCSSIPVVVEEDESNLYGIPALHRLKTDYLRFFSELARGELDDEIRILKNNLTATRNRFMDHNQRTVASCFGIAD